MKAYIIRSWPENGVANDEQYAGAITQAERRAWQLFCDGAHEVIVYEYPVTASSVQLYRLRRESLPGMYNEIRRRLSMPAAQAETEMWLRSLTPDERDRLAVMQSVGVGLRVFSEANARRRGDL